MFVSAGIMGDFFIYIHLYICVCVNIYAYNIGLCYKNIFPPISLLK